MSVVRHVIQTQPIMQYLHVLQLPVIEMLIIKVVAVLDVINAIRQAKVEVVVEPIYCTHDIRVISTCIKQSILTNT